MAGASKRIIPVLGLMFALVAAPARAGDDSAGGQAARALIEKQLDAFSHDDAAAAYALAAPGLKTIFSDPDVFMAMVRGKYAPVYRHRSVDFGVAEVDGDNVSQIVTIVDEDNQVWKALYKLARQPDGRWLINGCLLIKSTDAAT
jgi:ABC-type amino acid transport substrate-binding protein